jgi:surface antigen
MESSGNRTARGALIGGLLVVVWMVAGCDNAVSSGKSGNSPATAPLDYLAAQGQAKKHSEKVVSLAQVQQALQQFQATEDRWPKDLQELVKAGFLAAVPAAPAGQRVVYDANSGTVRIVRVQP